MLGLILFESLFLSLKAHKEDRFLMKLFPFILIYIGIGANYLLKNMPKKAYKILKIIAIINGFYFFYSALIDKRGAIDSLNYVRNDARDGDKMFMFTECHRTPFYAYIHR